MEQRQRGPREQELLRMEQGLDWREELFRREEDLLRQHDELLRRKLRRVRPIRSASSAVASREDRDAYGKTLAFVLLVHLLLEEANDKVIGCP